MTTFRKTLAATAVLGAMLSATPAFAEQGDWLLRARAINVIPNESSSDILPAFPGEDVSVDNSVMPEFDITYMATDNIGFELIAAVTQHTATGQKGTTAALGPLANTWVLPPTLTVQYHFAPEGKVRPYVGAGVNYTIFFAEDASNALEGAIGPTDVNLDDSFGFALQAGIDVELNERVFLNFDIKYIDMDTTARFSPTAIGPQTVDISLDPLVIGVGVGIKL